MRFPFSFVGKDLLVGEFSGYSCDGPDCGNTVDVKEPEARRWLKVAVKNDSFNEEFTFCSYDCFEHQVHDTTSTQQASYR